MVNHQFDLWFIYYYCYYCISFECARIYVFLSFWTRTTACICMPCVRLYKMTWSFLIREIKWSFFFLHFHAFVNNDGSRGAFCVCVCAIFLSCSLGNAIFRYFKVVERIFFSHKAPLQQNFNDRKSFLLYWLTERIIFCRMAKFVNLFVVSFPFSAFIPVPLHSNNSIFSYVIFLAR